MSDKTTDPYKGMIRIFVYGTLKEGHGNHRLLKNANAKFVGYDSVRGPFTMVNMGGFPGIYMHTAKDDDPEVTVMRGELWAVEPEGLAAIDMLEGHPNFYRRIKWWTDNEWRAWVYCLSERWCEGARSFLHADRELSEGIWCPSEEESEHWELVNDAA